MGTYTAMYMVVFNQIWPVKALTRKGTKKSKRHKNILSEKRARERREDTTREKEIANLEESMDYFYYSDSLILDFIFDSIMNSFNFGTWV